MRSPFCIRLICWQSPAANTICNSWRRLSNQVFPSDSLSLFLPLPSLLLQPFKTISFLIFNQFYSPYLRYDGDLFLIWVLSLRMLILHPVLLLSWEVWCQFNSCSFVLLLEVFKILMFLHLMFDFDVLIFPCSEPGCVVSPFATLRSTRGAISIWGLLPSSNSQKFITTISFFCLFFLSPHFNHCLFSFIFLLPFFGKSYYLDSFSCHVAYLKIFYVFKLFILF